MHVDVDVYEFCFVFSFPFFRFFLLISHLFFISIVSFIVCSYALDIILRASIPFVLLCDLQNVRKDDVSMTTSLLYEFCITICRKKIYRAFGFSLFCSFLFNFFFLFFLFHYFYSLFVLCDTILFFFFSFWNTTSHTNTSEVTKFEKHTQTAPQTHMITEYSILKTKRK